MLRQNICRDKRPALANLASLTPGSPGVEWKTDRVAGLEIYVKGKIVDHRGHEGTRGEILGEFAPVYHFLWRRSLKSKLTTPFQSRKATMEMSRVILYSAWMIC